MNAPLSPLLMTDPPPQSWELALFVPSAVLLTMGAAVYTFFCRNEEIDFDSVDNGPFPMEKVFKLPFRRGGSE